MDFKPEILAPAGDMQSALSGLAAGADAVYLGLKHFSARMEADNFSTKELHSLIDLARTGGQRINVAMNTFFKPGEESSAARQIKRLLAGPHPNAIIAQDPAIFEIIRQTGFAGELHLSTLANLTHQAALDCAHKMGAKRVVLPRELTIDELRLINEACPANLDLEVFVHGALCYCVSGRCWWSSYMGGKSGLRGRCVQPCRRVYKQRSREGRFFSCRDLSVDVLVKVLMELPRVVSWKIEGRKKGPHYVYHVVSAYRLLRDNGAEPQARKDAEQLLTMALGRPFTKAQLLPQSSTSPTAFGGSHNKDDTQTSSGMLCGKIIAERDGNFSLKTKMELLPKDLVRIGYEDESWHQTMVIGKKLPKSGSLTLKLQRHKSPKNNTPVFLIDRKEPELMSILRDWQHRLEQRQPRVRNDKSVSGFELAQPKADCQARRLDISLRSSLPRGRDGKSGIRPGVVQGLWLSPKAVQEVSRTLYGRISWWLPPVIWPNEEQSWKRLISQVVRGGARHIVCNAPWQIELFSEAKGVVLSAGPFCNITNVQAVQTLKNMGFSMAVVSPELSGEDYLKLPAQSPLPLGIVTDGFWPSGITRHSITPLKSGEIFSSPKNEGFWTRKFGQNVWIYPGWPLDINQHRQELERAGYSTFISMPDHPPKEQNSKHQHAAPARTSEFNWTLDVL